jgi:hypothetical protein
LLFFFVLLLHLLDLLKIHLTKMPANLVEKNETAA